MLNYGAALQDLSDEKILSRLKDFNCEWLSRPNIAISEMAQTIEDNWPLIEKQSGTVFTRKFVQDLGNVVLPLMDTYARLDNKDNSTHDPPTHDDVLDPLEVININPDVEQLMVTTFNVAGPVLMTSIQMLAVNALLHNVSNFAQEAVRSPATEEFKANPTKDSMIDYLFNSILMRRRTVERRTSLYDRSRLADREALPQPTRHTNSRTRRAVSLSGPKEDEPEPPTRPSRPRLGQRPPSATRSWRDGGQRRTHAVQEQEEVDNDEDDEPAPSLYQRKTSTPFTSRGLQWRPSTLSRRDSAIDLDDHQQTEDEVEDVVRPPRKRAKRGPTATVTTVEAVVSPAAEEDVTGTRHKKKQKKRHHQERLKEEAEEVVQASPPKKTKKKKNKEKEKYMGAWLADLEEAQEVVQASPAKKPKKKKNKEREKYTGACLADLAKDQDRLSKKLKKSKVAHS